MENPAPAKFITSGSRDVWLLLGQCSPFTIPLSAVTGVLGDFQPLGDGLHLPPCLLWHVSLRPRDHYQISWCVGSLVSCSPLYIYMFLCILCGRDAATGAHWQPFLPFNVHHEYWWRGAGPRPWVDSLSGRTGSWFLYSTGHRSEWTTLFILFFRGASSWVDLRYIALGILLAVNGWSVARADFIKSKELREYWETLYNESGLMRRTD